MTDQELKDWKLAVACAKLAPNTGEVSTWSSVILAADAELQALREDAANYRWLRSGEFKRQGVRITGGRDIGTVKRAAMSLYFWCTPEELDEYIAQMRKT